MAQKDVFKNLGIQLTLAHLSVVPAAAARVGGSHRPPTARRPPVLLVVVQILQAEGRRGRRPEAVPLLAALSLLLPVTGGRGRQEGATQGGSPG